MACALCTIFGATNSVNAAEQKANIKKTEHPQIERKAPNPEQMQKMKKAREAAFEQKLGLTEVQKLKARELRKAGHEKMKPVMDEIKTKRQEAKTIRNSKLTVEAQEEKLTVIDKDLAVLEKKAAQIRKQNMKDFEAILTKDQKKTLKNMKKEGRKNFEHVKHPMPIPKPQPVEK